jgi:hypothetical protein
MMKCLPAIAALALLLTACNASTSDASLRRRAIGVWISDSQPGKVIENKSDGTYVVRINGAETARGKWLATNGYLVGGPAGDWAQANPHLIESNKVIDISSDKAVLLSIDGRTPLTFHK